VSLRLVSESAFGSLGRALYAFTAIAIGSSLCFPDLAATQPVLASPTIDGAPPDGSSQYPAVSADGRYVAFYSAASNLVPNDTNGKSDVFVRDLQAGTTTRISVTSAGGQATGDSYGSGPVAISGNGRFVAFESRAALVPGTPLTCDSIICGQIYVHDLQTHTTTLASVSNAGITADGMSAEPQLSADGRYVLFSSDAGNLVPHDTNGNHDVFLHDRQTATTTRVSVAADGSQYDGRSDGGLLSGDGNVIIFTTNHLTVAPVARPCRPTFGYYTCWTKTLIDRTKGRENVSDSMGPTYAVNHDGRYAVTAVSDGANGRQWAEYSLYDRVTGQKVPFGPSSAGSRPSVTADGSRVMVTASAQYGGKLLFYDRTRTGTFDLLANAGRSVNYSALSADGSRAVFSGHQNSFTYSDIFALTVDGDKDGIPDPWETVFGLNPADAADAALDADGDGQSNLSEYRADSHPTGKFSKYLAEGSSNTSFSTQIAVLNPHPTPTAITVRMLRRPGEEVLTVVMQIPAHRRITVDPFYETERWFYNDFSTIVDSDAPVVVDRTMRLINQTGHGAAAETSTQPAKTWYFAEGATGGPFSLFYLFQNPGDETAHVLVSYLLPAPQLPIIRIYDVLPRSRSTVFVDMVAPELASANISAKITSDQPIVAERAMYLASLNQPLGAATGGAGAPALANKWFLAEGATGSFFDLYVLIANPGETDANVTLTYLLPDGEHFSKNYLVAKESRQTIFVDDEDPRLANTPVSIIAESTGGDGIVVERAQWWPQGQWYEGHLSVGATVTAKKWGLAEGLVAPMSGYEGAETYVLIANTSPTAGSATVTLMFESQFGQQPLTRTFALPANSRTNVSISESFPEALGRFGAVVESDGVELVVERAIYRNFNNVTWAAGTAALGTPLP
jgi:Tol biopolymer transport system component